MLLLHTTSTGFHCTFHLRTEAHSFTWKMLHRPNDTMILSHKTGTVCVHSNMSCMIGIKLFPYFEIWHFCVARQQFTIMNLYAKSKCSKYVHSIIFIQFKSNAFIKSTRGRACKMERDSRVTEYWNNIIMQNTHHHHQANTRLANLKNLNLAFSYGCKTLLYVDWTTSAPAHTSVPQNVNEIAWMQRIIWDDEKQKKAH